MITKKRILEQIETQKIEDLPGNLIEQETKILSQGMKDEEFADIKINWLIENKKTTLVENFLKQNTEFKSKSKAVQYLVDENISKANISRSI